MTIREYLMQRNWKYARRATVFLLVSGALVSIGTSGFIVRFVCAVVIAAVTVAAFWSLFEIPCPKCHKRLGVVGFKAANSGIGSKATAPAHCPHCNVNFDEPMP